MVKGYREYKPELRVEFSHSCAYCKIREPEMGGAQSFHIDHYKPRKKFPELENSYENLIYSCRQCNAYKGDFWPDTLDFVLGRVIVHPREEKIEEHINTEGFIWSGLTPKGRWTVSRLRLDSPVLALRREDRMRIERKILELTKSVDELASALGGDLNFSIDEREKIEADVQERWKDIESLRRKISGAMD